jgi:hypothetical protein
VRKIIGMMGLGAALTISAHRGGRANYGASSSAPATSTFDRRGSTPRKVRKGPGLAPLMSVAKGSAGIITRAIITTVDARRRNWRACRCKAYAF